MSNADKLLTIAENMKKVHNAGRDAFIGNTVKEVGSIRESSHSLSGKCEEIANGIKDVYEAGQASAEELKTMASGAIVAVHDVNPIEHDVAVKVSSKNLIPYPYYHTTKTENGITFTDNGDGSITLNGTATGTAMFYLCADWTDNGIGFLEDGETYCFSVSSPTQSVDTGSILIQGVEKATGAVKYVYAWNCPFVVEKDKYVYNVLRLQVSAGKTLDNVTVYPQLEKGTVATAYTPYNNRIGKNLLKTDGYTKGSLDVSTGGVFTNQNTKKYILTTDFIYLKSGPYVLSNKDGANLRNMCFYNLNKELTNYTWMDRVKAFSFTVTEDCYVRIDIERHDGVNIDNFDTFLADYECQLERGTTATAYAPYGSVSVRRYGKNLFKLQDFTYSPASGSNDTVVKDGVLTITYNTKVASQTPLGVAPFTSNYVGLSVYPAGTYTFYAEYCQDDDGYGTGKYPYLDIKLADGASDILEVGIPKQVSQSFTPQALRFASAVNKAKGGSYTTTLQVVYGESSGYEPFIEPVICQVEGDTGMPRSLSPNMTFIPDDNGLVLDCTYYKAVDAT